VCSRLNPHKCKFFLWDLDQEQAREWHMKYGPQPPAPETPKSDEPAAVEPVEDLGNPWTKSIIKRKPTSKEVSYGDEAAGPSNQHVEAVELASFRDLDPSRKAVKTTRFATPGQSDRSKNAEDSLPTPDTGGQATSGASGSRSRQSRARSATPQLSDAIIMRNERKSSLSAEVLKLIRAEKVGLKESVEIQIEHEIDTEVALYEQKLRGYKKTNRKLSRRLDEMESIVVLLGGDVGVDDSVEFSE